MTHRFAIRKQLLAFRQSIYGFRVFFIAHVVLVRFRYVDFSGIIINGGQELCRRFNGMRQIQWVSLEVTSLNDLNQS